MLVFLGGLSCAAPSPRTESELALPRLDALGSRPNIVVVLSDTHRRDHASPYEPNGERLTPNIALLARDGMRFDAARTSVPISAPAYATLLSGLEPAVHGVLNNGQHVPAEVPMLAESLRATGYATAAILSNPFTNRGYGFGRGFDHVWDAVEGGGKEGDRVSEAAIHWLKSRSGERPFFLFAAYMDAHTPYVSSGVPPSLAISVDDDVCCVVRAENAHAPTRVDLELDPGTSVITLRFLGTPLTPDPPTDGAASASPLYVRDLAVDDARVTVRPIDGFLPVAEDARYQQLAVRARVEIENPTADTVSTALSFRTYRRYRGAEQARFYAEGVRAFDRHVGRLFGYLRRAELWEDTVIVFLSDHGEMLGEHEAWGHVEFLWEEALRIPLVVKVPGVAGGRVDAQRFDLVDVHHLLSALGTGALAPHRDAHFPFRRRDPEAIWIAGTYPPESGSLTFAAVDDASRKLWVRDDAIHLFDLAADPGEMENLWPTENPDRSVRALAAAIRTAEDQLADEPWLDPSALSEEERARLEALGYLQ